MFSSRMPDPVWDSLYEPLDTATVVSDDIWKKFDLDNPASYQDSSDLMSDPISADVSSPLPQQYSDVPMMMNFDRLNCQATSEIRHHDCMWAGLCISKDHNRTHPAKKDPKIQRRIPAGRSLLIPKNLQQQQQQSSLLQHHHQHHHHQYNASLGQSNGYTCRSSASMTMKHLESDGDSTRPETPQSSGESETDTEEDEEEEEDEEVLIFKHEQISINDIVPVSEASGQHIQRRAALYDRRKEEENVIKNTMMSDHCYHLNQQQQQQLQQQQQQQQQPNSKTSNLEHLGVQTPSDSEEEIDVVSWDKPAKAVNTAAGPTLPTYPSPTEHQRLQHTVNTALKERHSKNNKLDEQSTSSAQQSLLAAPANSAPVAPRPRGRPPSNATVASRKRAAAAALEQAKADTAAVASTRNKRAKKHSTSSSSTSTAATGSNRKSNGGRWQASNKSSPQSSPGKNTSRANSSSEDEPDMEKRSLHNNMERQRRVDLKIAFEDLRLLVPEIEAKENAPKVTILREAASYCDELADHDELYRNKIVDLRRKQDRLKIQLGCLRRSLAMMR